MTQLNYQLVIQMSDEDDCFLVGFPDFPGQRWRTHGDNDEAAVTNGIEALESLIIAYEAAGDPLPEPIEASFQTREPKMVAMCGSTNTSISLSSTIGWFRQEG